MVGKEILNKNGDIFAVLQIICYICTLDGRTINIK